MFQALEFICERSTSFLDYSFKLNVVVKSSISLISNYSFKVNVMESVHLQQAVVF